MPAPVFVEPQRGINWREHWREQMFEIGGCTKVEKQEKIVIDKYYSYVKIIHKAVLDIYWVIVWLKVCQNSIFEQISIVGDNRVI